MNLKSDARTAAAHVANRGAETQGQNSRSAGFRRMTAGCKEESDRGLRRLCQAHDRVLEKKV
ncbi:MAG: hypothetical protein JNM66_03860 [Bryobacterales bacterium]|nr:hypothetical protein [Bryobacterales bacterium]